MLPLTLKVFRVVALVQLVSRPGHPVRSQAPVSAPDSARLARDVRSAQSSFEGFRRSRLPTGDRMGGECDVRIGRYCYWRGDDEEPDPPAEPKAIGERRRSLLRLLDSVGSIIPGDAWVAGQYVRYLVEAGRYDDALSYTRRCAAGTSWCLALAGYAAHSAGKFALADSAFHAALAAMPDAERCRWLDISDVLDDPLRDRFNRIPCERREAFVRHVLRIGAPLYSVTTSDLLTEHLSRLTRAKIAERAATVDGESWADDQRELVIRYGWPRWYTRWEPAFGSQMQRSITGHDVGMPFDFIPSLRAVDSVSEASDDDWHLDDARAMTGYAPAFAKTVHSLPAQLAFFRRGDSLLVVAAWDARRDTSMLGRVVNASVAALDDSVVRVSRADSVQARGRMSATFRMDSGIVSLELLAPHERRAARRRHGFAARSPSGVALSDLLLYTPGDSTPGNLAEARDSALASDEVNASHPIGVFWETYGLRASGQPVKFTLSVEQVGVTW